MYCKYCGAELAEDSRFCHCCGKKYNMEKKKTKLPELDERKEYVDVEAYIRNMGLPQKICLLFVMAAAAMWSAILVLNLFIPLN